MNTIYPKLSVVGAGPGDPELLTIKAITTIKQANVILYDALVNEEILKYANQHARIIYVGKRSNQHKYTQEQINNLIIDFAFTHGHVVRLKGGDPFVFGRGKEELIYAETFNIDTEIVPGISSSIAAAASVGIPVTHRGISESFWVITATTKNGELSTDLYQAINTNATLVILMGLAKLKQITEIYKSNNKGSTAFAIIQNATTKNEKVIVGDAFNIYQQSINENIQAPAVIVIGEVVKLHRYFENINIAYFEN